MKKIPDIFNGNRIKIKKSDCTNAWNAKFKCQECGKEHTNSPFFNEKTMETYSLCDKCFLKLGFIKEK